MSALQMQGLFFREDYLEKSLDMTIDLRSDTVTVPTDEMREIMARAPVGDDVYGEDPSVNKLEQYGADLLGKEAAVFVPSGVMGNQICIKALTRSGDEVLVDENCHIFLYEAAAPSIISSVQLRTLKTQKGAFAPEDILSAIRPADNHCPRTSLLCFENTHNMYGGSVVPLDNIRACAEMARENGLALHCDGARIWNASVAAAVSPAEFAAPFDTISVCLSKGLGAPIGSLVAGTTDFAHIARKWRKTLGGGMRQAGIIAAAGLYALQEHFALLAKDHVHARLFAETLAESPWVEVDPAAIQTNIVFFDCKSAVDRAEALQTCQARGVLLSAIGTRSVRAVFHHQISRQAVEDSAAIVSEALAAHAAPKSER